MARTHGVPVEGPWIRVTLAVTLERNRLRQSEILLPEDGIRSFERQLEPPTDSEGFSDVRVIDGRKVHRAGLSYAIDNAMASNVGGVQVDQ
ncbi:hypothetical protein [Methylobacterium sp. NEAU K]|uniref:hypothetical protein n=1 Tax=Methylobacterium sp. NEAU K TaxID=3064946 RepID=UPI00273271E0|nr:hypothetical protein [Methylobacterium sp. NEAU K]MDP4002060.1 hypothetical protein [Methylobacterium sp. NEAU K]